MYLDPFDEDFRKHVDKIRSEKLNTDQKIELTCSFIPGTTLRINRVKIPTIGFRVFDTPGVLGDRQHYAIVDQYQRLKGFNFNGEVKPIGVCLNPETSVWIGGITRIDLFSVDLKAQTFKCDMFFSRQVFNIFDEI